MNIVIFTDTYYPETNGIAISSKTLVDVLKENGNNVLVVTVMYDNKVPSNENYIYYLPFYLKKKKSLFTLLNIYNNNVYKHIKSFKPDIIQIQTNGQIGEIGRYTAKKLKVPFVFTYFSHLEEYAPYVDKGFYNRTIRAKERNDHKTMMNASSEFIVPSEKIKNYLRKKGIDRYINVINIGVDPHKFDIDESIKKDDKYFRKKFNIPESAKILLYVGVLSEEKNIDLLFRSFQKYLNLENHQETYLLIVGEGEYSESLKEMSKELEIEKNVIFVGKVNHDKIKSYLHLADIFVNPSHSETQYLSMMEAMSANCLVLMKEDEGLDNFVIKNKNGFTFNDENDFVEVLNYIFTAEGSELDKIRKQAYKWIVNDCSVEHYGKQVMEVYNRAKRKKW